MHHRVREVAAYEQEVKDNEARVQKMRDEGRDPYDIKKQVRERIGPRRSGADALMSSFAYVQEEVLGESYMMVPNSKARLRDSVEELAAFLVRLCFRATFACMCFIRRVVSRSCSCVHRRITARSWMPRWHKRVVILWQNSRRSRLKLIVSLRV